MDADFLKNITILVVDHIDDDRKALVTSLSKYFDNIIEFNNAEDAIEVYRRVENIDLIISTINLPETSGLELLKLVRETDINIPFIFTTTVDESKQILEAINLNVSSYIIKPINLNFLLQKIDFLCERKYYEKQLSLKQEEVKNYIKAVDTVSIIFKMSEDRKIIYMNKSMREASKYTKDDIKTLTFEKLIHPDIPKIYIEKTWKDLKEGKFWQGNTKFLTKDGETFYLNNTIFKVSNVQDEFITVAFLTTKDNLEKRDFHKKVIKTMKDANVREHQYKKNIEELQQRLKNEDAVIKGAKNLISTQKEKLLSKEKQLVHYELQAENLNKKYDKLIYSKKDEILNYIELLKNEKKRNELLYQEKEELLKEIEILKTKYNKLL